MWSFPYSHTLAKGRDFKMELVINGDARAVPGPLTVAELVAFLGLGDGPVAVEVNRVVVTRKNHATHRLAAGDAVELVRFVGGG
jgi:sulfur carrier protein